MKIEPEFSADRRGVAAYAGVEQMHDHLAASAAPGQVIYYPDAGPDQPDFLIAQEGVAYFFLKVTTDPHTVENDRLMLNPGNGQPAVSSPLGATRSKSVGVSKQVYDELDLRIFVVPALALLSQTVEPEVRNWGKTKKVKLLDQDDNFVDRLNECVTSGEFEVFNRPTAAEIEAVVEFLRPKPEPEKKRKRPRRRRSPSRPTLRPRRPWACRPTSWSSTPSRSTCITPGLRLPAAGRSCPTAGRGARPGITRGGQ